MKHTALDRSPPLTKYFKSFVPADRSRKLACRTELTLRQPDNAGRLPDMSSHLLIAPAREEVQAQFEQCRSLPYNFELVMTTLLAESPPLRFLKGHFSNAFDHVAQERTSETFPAEEMRELVAYFYSESVCEDLDPDTRAVCREAACDLVFLLLKSHHDLGNNGLHVLNRLSVLSKERYSPYHPGLVEEWRRQVESEGYKHIHGIEVYFLSCIDPDWDGYQSKLIREHNKYRATKRTQHLQPQARPTIDLTQDGPPEGAARLFAPPDNLAQNHLRPYSFEHFMKDNPPPKELASLLARHFEGAMADIATRQDRAQGRHLMAWAIALHSRWREAQDAYCQHVARLPAPPVDFVARTDLITYIDERPLPDTWSQAYEHRIDCLKCAAQDVFFLFLQSRQPLGKSGHLLDALLMPLPNRFEPYMPELIKAWRDTTDPTNHLSYALYQRPLLQRFDSAGWQAFDACVAHVNKQFKEDCEAANLCVKILKNHLPKGEFPRLSFLKNGSFSYWLQHVQNASIWSDNISDTKCSISADLLTDFVRLAQYFDVLSQNLLLAHHHVFKAISQRLVYLALFLKVAPPEGELRSALVTLMPASIPLDLKDTRNALLELWDLAPVPHDPDFVESLVLKLCGFQ